MAEASRRLGRRGPDTAGRRAWFLAVGVERLPPELAGLADLVTVRFPWGSLLRGALGLHADVTASIVRLVAPGGRLELTVSVTRRDAPAVTGLDGGLDGAARARMAAAFAIHGLELVDARTLNPAALATLHSTWGRRLCAGGERTAWRVTFARPFGGVG
jgi:16S rRNA (adenine(1408)-N(1))-methyltransferase